MRQEVILIDAQGSKKPGLASDDTGPGEGSGIRPLTLFRWCDSME